MARASKYPAEFRTRGVQLYRDSEGRTIAEGARELGVGAETFRKWVRQDEADRGEAPAKPTSAQLAEWARLRENVELRRTNEILRLASSFSPRRPGGGRSDAPVVEAPFEVEKADTAVARARHDVDERRAVVRLVGR